MTNREKAEEALFHEMICGRSDDELALMASDMCERELVYPCEYCICSNECDGCFIEDKDCIDGIQKWLEVKNG